MSDSYRDSYPSWLPKRPPPPVPASTYQSSPDPHPRAADVFSAGSTPGRKATPRSVRIIARDDMPWREPTGDSAETRVPGPPRGPTTPVHVSPHPRFRAPSLHLSLLRSPALSMRMRYILHPLLIFGHLAIQTYFDFNVVFMLLQVSAHPGPNNSSQNWSLAAAAYIACYALQLFGVFLLYEVIYSFWRRWRVKRPLILPIYLSSPAHNLAALTSYTHFCFLAYIRRSARPPWPTLSLSFSRRSTSPPLSSSPQPSSPVPPSPSPSDSSTDGFAFSAYIAERCYWLSQNAPTVVLLLPRAALSLSLLLAAQASGSGRDPTYFDANGALTSYARGVLFANAAWTAWRALVLLGSILGLWILSGTACAGLCGPRYRWEEEHERDFDPREKRFSGASDLTSQYPAADDTYLSDAWSWKEGTRERVREAWEFCLTSTRPGPGRGYDTSNVRREKPEEDFAGLEEVLAAVPRGVLSSTFYAAQGREALSDIIPPADEVRDAFGSQRSRRSDPLRVLPYPFKEFGAAGAAEGKGKEKEVPEGGLIPFPSPVPSPEEEAEAENGEEEEVEEEDGGDEAEADGEADEEDVVEARRTSESMSSLGQPVASRYPFAFRRTARSSAASASGGTRTPATTPSHSRSTPSTRGSHTHSTPSTRGSLSPSHSHSRSPPARSTPSNRESSDSPRSPASHEAEGPFIPPPPRRHGQGRRRRAGTAPSLSGGLVPPVPVSGLDPVSGPSARARTRTISASASNSSSSRSRGVEPSPEALYESADEHDAGRVPSPEADGSQEEAEKEDSVGLLSAAPSPRPSLAGIMHRRGSSAGTGSPAGSPASSSGRSRAQSLIHSLGQRASLGEFGVFAGVRVRSRSRSSSVARNSNSNSHSHSNSDSQYSESPRSVAGMSAGAGTGSRRESAGTGTGSASASASASAGRPSGEGAPGIEHTFGRPGELVRERERLERAEAAAGAPSDTGAAPASASAVAPAAPAVAAAPSASASAPRVVPPAGTGAEEPTGSSTGVLRRAASDVSGVAPSEVTERAPEQDSPPYLSAQQSRTDLSTQQSHTDLSTQQSRTDLSTAHESFVTAPMTIDSTTTDSGSGTTQTPSTWALRHHGHVHVPGAPFGHGHGPA